LGPASLDAVSFDAEGRCVALSGNLGLVRHEGDRWVRLTPVWPDFVYVRCLHVTRSGTALIGTWDAGILAVDLRTGKGRRVTLRR
jgi:hypothetical protein